MRHPGHRVVIIASDTLYGSKRPSGRCGERNERARPPFRSESIGLKAAHHAHFWWQPSSESMRKLWCDR